MRIIEESSALVQFTMLNSGDVFSYEGELYIKIMIDLLYEKKSEKQQIREKRSKDLAKLKRLLKNGVVEFSYKKKDGSVRKAKGTLKDELLPETDRDDERKKNLSKECFYYFDLKRDDFRCFIRDNFLEIKEKKDKK